MKGKKAIFSILYLASILCGSLMTLWLVVLSGYLILTGGTYSYQACFDDGSCAMVCNVPIFTGDDWLWVSFELYGVPLLLLLASIQTIRVLRTVKLKN